MIPQAFADVWDLPEVRVGEVLHRRAVGERSERQRVLLSRQLDHRALRDWDVDVVLNRGDMARLDEIMANTRGCRPIAFYPEGENALAWSSDLVKGTAVGVPSYGWLPGNGAVETVGSVAVPFGSGSSHLLRGADSALAPPQLVQQVGPFAGGRRQWHVRAWMRQHFAAWDRIALVLAHTGQTFSVEVSWDSGVPTIAATSSGLSAYVGDEGPTSSWWPVELVLDPTAVSWTAPPGGPSSLLEVHVITSAADGTGAVGTYDLDTLLGDPHDFSTGWSMTATVTADQLAGPFFAAVEADHLDATSSGQTLTKNVGSLTDGDDYCASLYIKADTSAAFDIGLGDTSGVALLTHARIDLGTGTAVLQGSVGAGSHNVYVEDLSETAPGAPSGWFRIGVDVTNVNATTGGTLRAFLAPGTFVGSGSVYAWGMRLDHQHSGGVAEPNPYAWRGNLLHAVSAGLGRGPRADEYRETRGEAGAPAAVLLSQPDIVASPTAAKTWAGRVGLEEVPI